MGSGRRILEVICMQKKIPSFRKDLNKVYVGMFHVSACDYSYSASIVTLILAVTSS